MQNNNLHPLFERLLTQFQARLVGTDDLDDYLKETDAVPTVLLIAGDPVRYPEGLDVAVVLPELCAQFPDQCRIALAKSSDEDAIAKRFGVHSRPTLLFLRGTQYMTTIVGILDWDVYVPRFGEALSAPTQRAPISIANVTPNTSCAS